MDKQKLKDEINRLEQRIREATSENRSTVPMNIYRFLTVLDPYQQSGKTVMQIPLSGYDANCVKVSFNPVRNSIRIFAKTDPENTQLVEHVQRQFGEGLDVEINLPENLVLDTCRMNKRIHVLELFLSPVLPNEAHDQFTPVKIL